MGGRKRGWIVVTGGVSRRRGRKGRRGNDEARPRPEPVSPDAAGGSEGESSTTELVDARRRVREDPSDVAARLALAALYRSRSEPELALEQLEAAHEAAPEDVDVLVALGSALAGTGRWPEAERELRRAQRLDPQRAESYSKLGVLLFKRGLYSQAEAELKRAIELDEQDGDAYFYRGEALNQLGRVDGALEMLERAVRYQPENGRAYYTMGIVYDRKHLGREATAMYRKAREVGMG